MEYNVSQSFTEEQRSRRRRQTDKETGKRRNEDLHQWNQRKCMILSCSKTIKEGNAVLPPSSSSADSPPAPLHSELESLFRNLSSLRPDLCALSSIGKSGEGRELWALRLSSGLKDRDDSPRALRRPMFKYVANMHGNEALGRELLDSTEIWLLPSLNPDGFAKASEGQCYLV
ncbi:Carboxypeptidase Dlike [Caligus rogercresseyi]|uniref:Carboxypeptidase Dlike n=1 Tax=Caligus rogercresseyi TaxID=217165 RepID=A0A7T8JV48_CALRO|nr:Carboxypeptidase Dlike [Caligus rogercresseyi]